MKFAIVTTQTGPDGTSAEVIPITSKDLATEIKKLVAPKARWFVRKKPIEELIEQAFAQLEYSTREKTLYLGAEHS